MLKPEVALIKILLDIDLYNTYRTYIDVTKDDQIVFTLYKVLDELIEEYKRTLTYDEYSYYLLQNIADRDGAFEHILSNLQKVEISQDIAQTLLNQFKERKQAHAIALLAIDVEEGRKSFADLTTHVSNIAELPQNIEESLFITDDLDEIYDKHVTKHGLRWRLNSLNRSLGSLRKGNFGFLFARPETGKTTFLASESTFWAEQLTEEDGDGIWFNNEEEGHQVKSRIYQASLGLTRIDLFRDRTASKEEFLRRQGHRLRLVDNASISKTDVEKICRKVNPSFIIFDQLDKIKGFVGDREDLRLGTIYQWARELAKVYGPVIAVCQADGTGEGKKWLTMENVANAKTAKQAEADWILGIGCTHQEGFEFIRHLHASKNKLPGDEDTDPSLRHTKIDVIIDPNIARYKDYE